MDRDRNKKADAFDIEEISKRGNLKDTLDLLLEAIRTRGFESDLYFAAANMAFRLGDLRKAEQLAGRLLEFDPEHSGAWMLYGEITGKISSIIRPGARFNVLSAADSDSDGLPGPDLGKIESKDVDMSRDGQKESLDFDTITYADICARQGYYNKALKIYQDHLKRNPDNEELRKKIESIRKRLGND